MDSRKKTKLLATASVLTALAIVLQWLGAATQIGSYTAGLLSGLLLIPMIDLGGIRYGAVTYAATTILSWVLIPDKEIPVVYMLLGFAPLIDPFLSKKLQGIEKEAVKTLLFILLCMITYPLIAKIFLMADLEKEFQMASSLVEIGFIGISTLIFILFLRCCKVVKKQWKKYKQINLKNF